MIAKRFLLPLSLAGLVISGSLCSSPETPVVSDAMLAGDSETDNVVEVDCLDLAFTVVPPRPKQQNEIRIATLNANFLFDGFDDGNNDDIDFPWKNHPEYASQHLDTIGNVIRDLDADMVFVIEVEDLTVLTSLIHRSLAGMDYQAYLINGTDTATGQNVGLLSRIPVDSTGRTDERVVPAPDENDYGVSKNLWAHVTLLGIPTTIIATHFRAKPTDSRVQIFREAQAEVIRRLVERELGSGREVIVLGDLNDYDSTIPDINNSVPITNVIERIRSAGYGREDDLLNVLNDVPQADRFTSFYDRDNDGCIQTDELSAIDHFLVSRTLYEQVLDVQIPHTYDAVVETDGNHVSDHFPIIVTFGDL